MSKKTITRSHSVTKTQLVAATALFLVAGGFAFIAIPRAKVKSAPVVVPKAIQKKSVQVKNQNAPAISLASCGVPAGGWQSGKRYVLSQDITPPANSFVPCLSITGNNITIDGQNHSISYQDNAARTAIRVEQSSVGIVIQNVQIRGFQESGITVLRDASRVQIRNNTFLDNTLGVSIAQGNTHEITGNTFRFGGQYRPNERQNFKYGVKFFGTQGARVSNNTFENLVLALGVYNSSSNVFDSNTVRGNLVGMQIANQSSVNSITRGVFQNNLVSAVIISDSSSQNIVASSTFGQNGGGSNEALGVHVMNNDQPQIFSPAGLDDRNNNPVNIMKAGALVVLGEGSNQNMIENNTFDGSIGKAIFVESAPQTTIRGNQILNGINDAVKFQNSRQVIFSNNTLRGNTSGGRVMEIEGAGTQGIQMTRNAFCGNFVPSDIGCARDVSARDGFSLIEGNRLEHAANNSVCGGVLVGSLSCQ